MSKYTQQLRWIVARQSDGEQDPTLSVTDRCKMAAPRIFNFQFPIWDENKRTDFEVDFLRHFYMEEICCETETLWKIMLEDWLVTNMPYWNLKFSAMEKKFDFLNNYDFTEKGKLKDIINESGKSSSNTTNKNSGKNFNKYYEVPSKNIVDITDHLNNATSDETTANGSSNVGANYKTYKNDTSDNTVTKTGRQGGNPSEMLAKYLESIQNVKRDLYEAMETLFMQIW